MTPKFGPKPRPAEKVRGKSIQIMVLPEEREQIEQLAEASGESVSSYCYEIIRKSLAAKRSKGKQ